MPTRKVLRAVAHNIGHSFTSLGSYYLDDSWAIQHLVLACRTSEQPNVEIDLLTGVITPPDVRTPSVLKALTFLREHFAEMVVRSGSSLEFVVTAKLSISFRLHDAIPGAIPNHHFAQHVIVPERVPFHCDVTVHDDHGVEHRARVKEWWREN